MEKILESTNSDGLGETAWNEWGGVSSDFRLSAAHCWVLIAHGSKNEKNWILISPFKVHIFWEGHKTLQNLHFTFDWNYIEQIYGGDFAKLCGLLRIHEIYLTICIRSKEKPVCTVERETARENVDDVIFPVRHTMKWDTVSLLCKRRVKEVSWRELGLTWQTRCRRPTWTRATTTIS